MDWISPDDQLPDDGQSVIATDGLSVLPVTYHPRLRKYTWGFNRYVTEPDKITSLEGNAYFREGTVTGWKPTQ